MDGASDAELAREVAARGGRAAEAEAALCRRLAPRVLAYGRRHLRDPGAAHDLVQAVLMRVLERLRAGGIDDPGALGAFVLGTCRRVASDWRRTGARRAELLEQARPVLESLARAELPIDRLDVPRLVECVERLAPRPRTVILLGFVAELSGAEIAAELGVSEANARVLRHRALASLRDCVEGAR